ncbi:MAG: hypothetical protein ABIO39_05970, partial [Caulobacteraceae bacterium]
MQTRLFGALVAGALLLATAGGASAAATGGGCDAACLKDVANKYLEALGAHNGKAAVLAANVRYTENGVDLRLPDGLWRTASNITGYRLWVPDPSTGTIGFFSVMQENGGPVLLSTRLKVVGRKVTEAEAVVARTGANSGPSANGGDRPSELGAQSRPAFSQVLKPSERRSRAEMIRIANMYFTGLENNDGSKVPPFAADCHRLENGAATTNRPVPPGGKPNSATMGCTAAFSAGYYREDTRLRDRRFMAVDEEHGLVFAGVFFDHDATVRSYKLKNGTTNTV